MRIGFVHVGLFMGALSFTAAANAQLIVHAMAGKLTAVTPGSGTIEIAAEDGSASVFGILTQKNVPLNFDKNVKAMTTPASSFTKANCEVVVFYFGDEGAMTTVAVEDLGASPLVKALGTVVKLDKHAHLLTIKDDAGKEQTFHIDAKTLADSSAGVVEGSKFDADKGAKVRVVASTENGASTALFIRALTL
jgi:hypothetical protein